MANCRRACRRAGCDPARLKRPRRSATLPGRDGSGRQRRTCRRGLHEHRADRPAGRCRGHREGGGGLAGRRRRPGRARRGQGRRRGDRRCRGDAALRVGFEAARELPIIGRIALGSLRNKLVFLLPGRCCSPPLAPWAITPLLMLGGCYLSFGGREGRRMAGPACGGDGRGGAGGRSAASRGQQGAGAIKTDFILSAEIMAITLATVPEPASGPRRRCSPWSGRRHQPSESMASSPSS